MSTDTDPAPRTSPHAGTVDRPAGNDRVDPSVSVAIPRVALPVSLAPAGAARRRRGPHGRRTARWLRRRGRRISFERYRGRRRAARSASTEPQPVSPSPRRTRASCARPSAGAGREMPSSSAAVGGCHRIVGSGSGGHGRRRVPLETSRAHPAVGPGIRQDAGRRSPGGARDQWHPRRNRPGRSGFSIMSQVTCCAVDHCHDNRWAVGNNTQSAHFLSLC